MKHVVLLIEDSESDFERVKIFFQSYNIDFYPSTYHEFVELSRKLILYTRENAENKTRFLNEIIDLIKKISPTIVLIDLGLSGKKESLNQDGLEIFKWIKKTLSASIQTFIFSRYENNGTIDGSDGYIQKEGQQPIEKQMLELIIKRNEIPIKDPTYVSDVIKTSEKSKSVTDNTSTKEYKISSYEKVSNFFFNILTSWMPLFIDAIITFVFQLSIVLLFVFAPIDIIVNSGHNPDSFRIAERCFIAFLPFLIVCGFYIFYKKSLRAYFLRTVIDPRNEDFESASVLMKLTKKLFISSLLSYLFIKVIELLFFEEPQGQTNYFTTYYGIQNRLVQLYITAGLIIILIIYYLYIDRHQNNRSSH